MFFFFLFIRKSVFFLEAIKEAEFIDLFSEFFKTLFRLIDEEFLLLILVRTAVFNLEPDNSFFCCCSFSRAFIHEFNASLRFSEYSLLLLSSLL